jgi:hypothetical protein
MFSKALVFSCLFCAGLNLRPVASFVPLRQAYRYRQSDSPLKLAALRPLKKEAVDRLVPFVATPEQLAWFSGKDGNENYEQFLETTMIAFVGLWASYFASFFLGSAFSILSGTVREQKK